ncbi:DUF397 domain-containing protein [Pseudonocardia humida]|uniref:DUF397 domain-containing protein n=1 Tax=Pseudonocardia humida TaxID=2800819 RepID=A0ABT0ZUR7_9PSEU|nr:DUF397 domain-containing protein [Pseudonocardia humida]MCO1654473.1 DUF397 domain-containing protein [Pseudonocardia humida]
MDQSEVLWRTSGFSGNSCVEVAFLPDSSIGLRDTKDRSRPPQRYSATAWASFLGDVRADRFTRR